MRLRNGTFLTALVFGLCGLFSLSWYTAFSNPKGEVHACVCVGCVCECICGSWESLQLRFTETPGSVRGAVQLLLDLQSSADGPSDLFADGTPAFCCQSSRVLLLYLQFSAYNLYPIFSQLARRVLFPCSVLLALMLGARGDQQWCEPAGFNVGCLCFCCFTLKRAGLVRCASRTWKHLVSVHVSGGPY